jgi:hypothetical protein
MTSRIRTSVAGPTLPRTPSTRLADTALRCWHCADEMAVSPFSGWASMRTSEPKFPKGGGERDDVDDVRHGREDSLSCYHDGGVAKAGFATCRGSEIDLYYITGGQHRANSLPRR